MSDRPHVDKEVGWGHGNLGSESQMKGRLMIWRICCGAAILLMTLAFSPVFIPTGVIQPTLFGVPYTLWSGIVLCIVMLGITYVATVVHPGRHEETSEDPSVEAGR